MPDYTTYTGSSGNVRNVDEYLTLGMFIQDPESAADPGTEKAALNSSFQAKLGSQLYGFRFLFNPPNIAWSASVNNSVDWSMGNPNNAVIVGAGIGGQISFEILLDRNSFSRIFLIEGLFDGSFISISAIKSFKS